MNASIKIASTDDAAGIAQLFGDPALAHGTDIIPYLTAVQWKTEMDQHATSGAYTWVAIEKEKIVGYLRLLPQSFPRRKHVAELSIVAVAPSAQKTGIGKRLVQTALDACDRWLQVRRIETVADFDNTASLKLLQSFGFNIERRMLKDLFRNGEYVDGIALARINQRVMPAGKAPALPARANQVKDFALKNLEIRAAEPTDVDGVSAVSRNELAALGTLQSPYTAASTRAEYLRNPPHGRYPLVALYEGTIIGSAGIGPIKPGRRWQHVGYIGLGVADAYQGLGVGTQLMEALLDIADRWANYPRVDLAVFTDNTNAIALYKRLGFVEDGRMIDHAFRGGGYADSMGMGRLRS